MELPLAVGVDGSDPSVIAAHRAGARDRAERAVARSEVPPRVAVAAHPGVAVASPPASTVR